MQYCTAFQVVVGMVQWFCGINGQRGCGSTFEKFVVKNFFHSVLIVYFVLVFRMIYFLLILSKT